MQHGLCPFPVRVRSQLEDHTTAAAAVTQAEIAAHHSRAVEIPCRIKDQASSRLISVPPTESVEHTLHPASVRLPRELKDHATAGAAVAAQV